MRLDVNTTSRDSTHFLAGVQLVRNANDEFKLGSENWAYPSQYRCGEPWADYYSELWVDGMDWTQNWWLLESSQHENPIALPLVYFASTNERERINEWDFTILMEQLLIRRRELILPRNTKPQMIHYDAICPFLANINEDIKGLTGYSFEHHSQPKVTFWINDKILIPLPPKQTRTIEHTDGGIVE